MLALLTSLICSAERVERFCCPHCMNLQDVSGINYVCWCSGGCPAADKDKNRAHRFLRRPLGVFVHRTDTVAFSIKFRHFPLKRVRSVCMQRLCYFASTTLRSRQGASRQRTGTRHSKSMASTAHTSSESKDVVVVYVTVPSRDEGALVMVLDKALAKPAHEQIACTPF